MTFIVGEVYLGYRIKGSLEDATRVSSSADAEKVLRSVWDAETINLRESFKVLLLNRSNRTITVFNLSEGGVSGTVADVRLVVQAALLGNASGVILAHNHPSGSLGASESDRQITTKIRDALKLFGIELLDHLILTNENYYSFSDSGAI
jgi:DNA repair protein RadC